MLLFKLERHGGFGGFDNYVCFKNPDGSWTAPKNLGDKINSPGKEASADLSPDGKYLFFGRDGDIYWVESDFLQGLK